MTTADLDEARVLALGEHGLLDAFGGAEERDERRGPAPDREGPRQNTCIVARC